MTLLPALDSTLLALRLLPAGVVASLLLAVTLVLAAAVAGLMAYHYAQARIRERRGFTFDPASQTVSDGPEGAADVRARSAEEIAGIRSRIEALMSEQNLRVETQGQHLAQKLDDIRVQMDAQDRHVDGLKSELRHEIRRRDGELDDLRGQLASALDAFWKTMPALAEGAGGDALALPPASITESTPAPAAAPAPAPPPDSAPAPVQPVAPPAWADASAFAPAAVVTATPPPMPDATLAPGGPAVEADDLTIIRGIDADTQRKLNAAGIFHLDEVARWSRADARRIAGAVDVAEETIMHEWIFEAQSVLFDSYQRQSDSAQVAG